MKTYVVVFMAIFVVESCKSECTEGSLFTKDRNRALLNHVLNWKVVSSPVICGRHCSVDPQCASFNYHNIRGICVLNNSSRAHSLDDFVKLQGSVYYDDLVNKPSFPASSNESYSSCLVMYQAGYRDNGIYTIFPTSPTVGLQVYCDMETDGGGWIVFQRRQDGSVDFYRNWTEYQSGFGDRQNEFWLGNDILRDLTGSGQWQLRVDMEDWQSNTAWASYGEFAVTGEKYTLQVGSYDAQSTAGDSMAYHNGQSFSTKDKDNDLANTQNCANQYNGAWWYNHCHHSNLNGKYYQRAEVSHGHGIQWRGWKGYYYSLNKCSMKVRQVV